MNYHPVLLAYANPRSKSHSGYLHELAVMCLEDKNKIISFRWSFLANAMGDSGLRHVLSRVYDLGWDHDEGTRNMKKRFQDIVNFEGLGNKSLEDYL